LRVEDCHVLTDERIEEYERIVRCVAAWAQERRDIVGVAVVGSWACGAARMDSDIDLVILTSEKESYVATEDWVQPALDLEGEIVRTQEWGPVTERRVRLPSGLELEFGFTAPSWAAIDPVDAGTARVVVDGCVPLVDHDGYFRRLISEVQQQNRPSDS
jgi:predicted nucleotidyltransferase